MQDTPPVASVPPQHTTTPGSEAAYQRWRPQAEALPAEQIRAMGASDGHLALYNCQRGTLEVLPLQASLAKDLPTVEWSRLGRIPDLALAVIHAEALADGTAPAPSEVPALRTRVAEARHALWFSAQALVAAGILPAEPVEAVKKGRGVADQATDVGVLVGLFRDHWTQVQGKTALDGDFLGRADADAAGLLQIVKPQEGHARAKDAQVAAAQAMRDRLWTLLVREYTVARKVGFWQWGEDLDAHVPSLRARRG